VSTRRESPQRLIADPTRVGTPSQLGRLGPLDPVQAVALVARSRRHLLLAAHRHRLSCEDLEDCYSQATLELLTRARDRAAFASHAHIANALEQRLLSRIHDRRRALSGRSPIEAAIATALPLAGSGGGGAEIVDVRADVERLVHFRHELLRVSQVSCELSPDQRLVLKSQLACDMECREFCRTYGWSSEKYRKVAQRARARLARLLADERLARAPQRPPVCRVACPVPDRLSD
jgi:DNA-directed RNA polymerase specialized sigma24 family protein